MEYLWVYVKFVLGHDFISNWSTACGTCKKGVIALSPRKSHWTNTQTITSKYRAITYNFNNETIFVIYEYILLAKYIM